MSAELSNSPVPLAEISQGPNAFEQFLDRNQRNLIVLAVLLALGAAALVIYRGIEQSQQETAGAALTKADDLAALQAVINAHAGTIAAHSAMVLLADRQWTAGQHDAAIDTLRKFIAANPDHPALPAAQASLGAKLMSQGKAAEASGVFQALADDAKAGFLAPYALICLGDIAKSAADLDKAAAAYNRVKTDFPDSGFADTATKRIVTLKTKPPVEIQPPPVPKSDPPPAAPAPTVTPAPSPAPPAPQAPQP
ncbi:MAG: tetratricopeptide repeat protein [Verrucomicrobiota bacterium]